MKKDELTLTWGAQYVFLKLLIFIVLAEVRNPGGDARVDFDFAFCEAQTADNIQA